MYFKVEKLDDSKIALHTDVFGREVHRIPIKSQKGDRFYHWKRHLEGGGGGGYNETLFGHPDLKKHSTLEIWANLISYKPWGSGECYHISSLGERETLYKDRINDLKE